MDQLYIYKAKGFNANLNKRFKVLIAANSFDEAWNIADKLVGPGGWIISVKDTDKEVIIEEKECT